MRDSAALVHATYGKTRLFVEALKSAGYRPSEITLVCTQATEWSETRTLVPEANIVSPALAPDRRKTPWDGLSPSRLLTRIATEVGLAPIDLVLGDRYLRRHPVDKAVHWLNVTASNHDAVLGRESPDLVVGETANASEILLAGLAALRGIPYVQPATMRIPSDRFGLWLGAHSSSLWSRQKPSTGAASSFLVEWLESTTRPFYFEHNSRSPQLMAIQSLTSTANAVRRFSHRQRFEMQQPLSRDYLHLPWMNRFRKAQYARRAEALEWSDLPNGPFVFYPLHVQPEGSIDWYPSVWRDQLFLVEYLSGELRGRGITLVVKDHPNFIWSRGAYFHERILSTVGVRFVHPGLSTTELMRAAVGTLTVSGTAGMEAGLRGLPVAIASNHPWAVLPTVTRVERPEDVVRLTEEGQWGQSDPQKTREWFEGYWSNSWAGTIADAHNYPQVLDADNVSSLAGALEEFVNRLPSRKEGGID